MYKTIQKVRRHVSHRGDVGIKLLHRQKRSFSFQNEWFRIMVRRVLSSKLEHLNRVTRGTQYKNRYNYIWNDFLKDTSLNFSCFKVSYCSFKVKLSIIWGCYRTFWVYYWKFCQQHNSLVGNFLPNKLSAFLCKKVVNLFTWSDILDTSYWFNVSIVFNKLFKKVLSCVHQKLFLFHSQQYQHYH